MRLIFNYFYLMKKYSLFPLLFLLGISCTPDSPFTGQSSDTTIDDSIGVDTFSVKRPPILTEEEKKQLAIDKKSSDSIENEVSTIINQGNPDKTEKIFETTGVVTNPDVGPSFPGGQDAMDAYINKKRIYPLVAFQNEIKGVVNLKFVIESDGKIGGIRVVKGLGYGCDEAAIDLIQGMPHWIPGKKGGANVRCVVSLPISFGQ